MTPSEHLGVALAEARMRLAEAERAVLDGLYGASSRRDSVRKTVANLEARLDAGFSPESTRIGA